MDLKATVISIGVINITTGKTMYDWSIYDHAHSHVFLTNRGFLLYASPDTFKVGDVIKELRDNDSLRKVIMPAGTPTIVDSSPCVKDDVLAMLKRNGYDYYPIRAFRARPKGNRKLSTSYSVKGTDNA